MTTIVYRDGVLAADCQINDDGVAVGAFQKIMSVGDIGYFALTGSAYAGIEMVEWLENWPDLLEAPKCATEGNGNGIFILRDGTVYEIEGSRPYKIAAPFFAEGSGRFIALGALAMGATAEQAVDVAIRFDNGSGGPIQTVRVD